MFLFGSCEVEVLDGPSILPDIAQTGKERWSALRRNVVGESGGHAVLPLEAGGLPSPTADGNGKAPALKSPTDSKRHWPQVPLRVPGPHEETAVKVFFIMTSPIWFAVLAAVYFCQTLLVAAAAVVAPSNGASAASTVASTAASALESPSAKGPTNAQRFTQENLDVEKVRWPAWKCVLRAVGPSRPGTPNPPLTWTRSSCRRRKASSRCA